MLRGTLFFVVFIALTNLCYAQDNQASWLDYSLKSLNSASKVPLKQYKGKPVLMSFFEPECSWCFRQLRDLSKLQNSCQDRFQTLAMGVNGAAKQLRQLYARTGVKFPAFIVSNRMMADIGDVPATPITVLLDEAGHAISAVRGYQSLDKLQTILQQSAAETFDYCL